MYFVEPITLVKLAPITQSSDGAELGIRVEMLDGEKVGIPLGKEDGINDG
jgi:hypothetical protein